MNPTEKTTHAELVEKLATELPRHLELFHTHDRTPFVTFTAGDHRETWPIKSEEFEFQIRFQFWRMFGTVPPPRVLKDVIAQLIARALFDGPEKKVFTRIGEQDGAIYLDLGDPQWRLTEITAAGWRLLPDSQVKFLRHPGMTALPVPVPGGGIEELHRFLNLPDDERTLFLSFLLMCFHPLGAYPLLILEGAHGSGKTTLARIARAVVDPSSAPTQSPPREERDLRITAETSWLIVLDNLSRLGWRLSDALCRLSTGGGLRIRKHYRNRSEQIFHSIRPVVINSIEPLVSRGDLLDRSLILRVPTIATEKRQSEAEFWSAFNGALPGILGALLDAAVLALRNVNSVILSKPPRMADFARWAVAGESGLGLAPGAFLRAYEANRTLAHHAALEASPVVGVLVAFMQNKNTWRGNLRTLWDSLMAGCAEGDRPDMPRSVRALRAALDRLHPHLLREGIEVAYRGHDTQTRRRLVSITRRLAKQPKDRAENHTSNASDTSDGNDAATKDLEGSEASEGCFTAPVCF
jgi:hypothetical protein